MKKHLYIVTGTSRGLGLALAQQLLLQGGYLLGIARHTHAGLTELAQQQNCTLEQWPRDLADSTTLANELHSWLEHLNPSDFFSITLINNAGVIPALQALSAIAPTELAHALRVNLEAPMLLTASFLNATQDMPIPRKVLNISSGLGRRPMASQSAYCAAKAGLDHFTRCLALDEARNSNAAKVCSLAPGVIDTDMQTQLRNSSPDAFPDQGNFEQLYLNGQLSSANSAANQVLTWLHHPNFGQQVIADVRTPQA
jgi:NAD(P)-dependent dehydrogenase (short-subunit alcohol dehydrogenase family)